MTPEQGQITGMINDDVVQPFILEKPNFRGRMVRLSTVVHDVVKAHDYPLCVQKIVIDSMTLTTLLAGMLKFDGIFTMQISGNGAIPLVVCDLTNDGAIRAYASVRQDKLKALEESQQADTLLPKDLIGEGHLAFTVDQNKTSERYQGIVSLNGERIIDSVQHYFQQSEQIKTGIKLFREQDDTGQWHAGAIMLQSLPTPESAENGQHLKTNIDEDDWRRAMILLDTATDKEMLNDKLPVNDMIFRLFHEEQVRVFEPLPIVHQCRCSRDRVADIILKSVPQDQVPEYLDNGIIHMTCEFCNTRYEFTQEQLDDIYALKKG